MQDKLYYFTHTYIDQLHAIPELTTPVFGKMNVHQMIEHMSYAFRQATGLIPLTPHHDASTTEKMYQFMMSDKPFKDNTPNPYLPDMPPPPVTASVRVAIQQLQHDIDKFIDVFVQQPELRVQNPFFGNLNFNEWQHLLFKHAQHHLRQFNAH